MATRAAVLLLTLLTAGCSTGTVFFDTLGEQQTFSTKGSVIVSKQMPTRTSGPLFAFMPADEETGFASSGRIVKSGRLDQLQSGDTNSFFAVHAYLGNGDLSQEAESSGRVLITRPIPKRVEQDATYPLFAFIPPALGFEPATNETWLEIEKETNEVRLKRGATLVKEFKGEGMVDLDPGLYSLQHKQRRPLWYAPDSYFAKRQLQVPGKEDRARYRRGALGQYVLYPTTTFPIHSGPLWTQDVGGLRVSRADLSSIYYMMPIGASIVVK